MQLWKVLVFEEKCKGELKSSGVKWKEAAPGPYSPSIDWEHATWFLLAWVFFKDVIYTGEIQEGFLD